MKINKKQNGQTQIDKHMYMNARKKNVSYIYIYI